MPTELAPVFATLKPILETYADEMRVLTDTAEEYALVSNSPSPFHRGKDQPLHFGSVRMGKAYVSFHLMPLYMSETLKDRVTPALKKRMQGKTCFNFKKEPEPELLEDLKELTSAGYKQWADNKWL